MNVRRHARRALLALFSIATIPAAAVAATVDTLDDPNLVMIVNGRNYPLKPVEIMLAAAQSTRAEATLAQMADSLVDNQLIVAQALKEFGRNTLLGSTHVGIPPAIILEDQYSTMLRTFFHKELDAFVKAQPGGNLNSLIDKRIARNDPALAELMTLRTMGEVELTPKQYRLAKQTAVATVRMPDGHTTVLTYADIYDRQTVQGRVKLVQEHDTDFLDSQVRNRVDSLFVKWWVATKSGLSAADIALLHTMLEEKYLKLQYLNETGVSTAMHEDMPAALEKLQKKITDAEIRDWYEKNREQFRQIEKVRARQIECRTEDDCKAALAAIQGGMDFSDAAKKFSIAPTRNATPAGALGWIERHDNKLGWIGEVAMIGKQGAITGPIRSPADAKGLATWDLVITDERVEGYNPVDSETVRFQARQEIAKRKATEKFKAMRERVLAAADIHRNGKLIQAYPGKAP